MQGGQEILLRNNTGTKSKSVLIEGFVVRTGEYEQIKKGLISAKSAKDVRNTILIGQRGAGKTTLLHRLNYSILDEKVLSDRYLPIMFSEEQYFLSDLTNLWEGVAASIDDNFFQANLTNKIEEIISRESNYEKKVFSFLEDFLIQKNKIVLLFIENINVFLRKLSENERKRLKSVLQSKAPFRLIGSSTAYNDGTIDLGDSFYSFISLVFLDGLTQDECERLLIKIGQQYGEEDQIREVINKHPGRVEALRRLTGGIPRTISYLFQIFLDNENGKAIKDLYLLVDTLSLLYKSELDQLSTQQQKVVDVIARNWDAISVKEIVRRTRLESKNVSSILAYLDKNQVIEVVSVGKNNLYRIKERFMNIWYLMRFGRKHDKDNVIWLVRFFDAWCDESELTKRIKRHIDNLKDGKYDISAAIDMGNTFLSCENIPESLKEELIKTTNSVLPNRLLKNVRASTHEILNKIKKLVENNKHSEAESLLEDVEEKDLDFYMLSTAVYLTLGDHDKALQSALAATKINDESPYALVSLATIYDLYLGQTEEAIQLYKKCLSLPHPHPYAAHRMGEIAHKRKNYNEAIEYHMQAISRNMKQSLLSIARVYFEIRELGKAESYAREAAKSNVENANSFLARVLKEAGRKNEVRLALRAAVEANESGSNVALGKYYLSQKKPDFKKAEFQFREAIARGFSEGYNQLARLYLKKGDAESAIAEYKAGVSQGNAESAHRLGHLFSLRKDFVNSDEMFSKAIELGKKFAVGCWVESIYRTQRKESKHKAIELMRKWRNEDVTDRLPINLLFAKILLWGNEVSESKQILTECIKGMADLHDSVNGDEEYLQRALSELLEYFLLLIAKGLIRDALNFFEDHSRFDLKAMLKPIYYILMENMKEEFPNEYLKAGKELEETIKELKKEIINLKSNV